jgi:hypothetical protein
MFVCGHVKHKVVEGVQVVQVIEDAASTSP